MPKIGSKYVTVNELKIYLTRAHASLTHASPLPETENFFRKNKDSSWVFFHFEMLPALLYLVLKLFYHRK